MSKGAGMRAGWRVSTLEAVCKTVQDGAHQSPQKRFAAPGVNASEFRGGLGRCASSNRWASLSRLIPHRMSGAPSFHRICRNIPSSTGASRAPISSRSTRRRIFSSVEAAAVGLT